jgi:sugar phosphate isomerase/epimerase
MEITSFRREMQRDVSATLARVRSLGFHEVEVPELFSLTAEEFRTTMERIGLRASALAAESDSLSRDLRGVEGTAVTLGASWIVLPSSPRSGTFIEADARRAAKDMNTWSGRLASVGLRFAYHPHGYEFQTARQGTLFDAMAAQTDPAKVFFAMDTFSMARAGQDCVQLLARYSGRFRLMHLKDLRKGTKTDLTGQAADEDSVALGSGSLNWPAILRAARQAGVERYYIEDESPQAAKQIPDSLVYLHSLNV